MVGEDGVLKVTVTICVIALLLRMKMSLRVGPDELDLP